MKKSILSLSDYITDFIYKYGWQLSYKHEGPVKVQPISRQKNKMQIKRKQ